MTPLSTWDHRYLRMARHVASWSKDPSTQCGAVLVRPNRTLASVGFNGFPSQLADHPHLYADRSLKYPRVLHSEWNAIRTSMDPSLQDYTVYAWPMPPCDLCTASLVQKGVRRVVCPRPTPDKIERWGRQFELALGTWENAKADIHMVDVGDIELMDLGMDPHASKWARRFLAVAHELSTWSKDPIAPRGTVISRPSKTIASMGFSGFPQGQQDEPLLFGDTEVRNSRLLSAELNAILFSQDPTLDGCAAHTWPGPPDMRATVHLIGEGIQKIVFPVGPGISPIANDVQEAWEEAGATIEMVAASPRSTA